MASLFSFGEDNGAATGSPASGTTRTLGRTDVNWKAIDDSTTAYTSSPIRAGQNSFVKYQFGAISGTFNQLSNGKIAHTSGVFGAGLTLVMSVTSGYVTPATGTLAGTNITAVDSITNGISVLFGANPPNATGTTLNSTPTGYTQYFASQLQTTTGAAAGDTAQVALTFQYDES